MDSVDELPRDMIRPLRRSDYDRLIEMGAFEENEHVELIYGQLVAMSPHGQRHAHVIQELNMLLSRALSPADFRVRVQLPIAASEISEPEPDLSVVPAGDYLDDHPKRALLAIEVADSSGRIDRKIKARLYAECAIPEYWIVDVAKGVVEVLRDPRDGAYQTITKHGRGETLRPVELAGVALRTDDFLPPR